MEEGSADKSRLRRIWKRFTGATARLWLLTAALLGVGMLPCPECGALLMFHVWPLAGLALAIRALKRRYWGESSTEKGGEEKPDAISVYRLRQ